MPTSKDLTDLDSQLKKTLISAESFKRGSSFDISKSIANIHKTVGTLAGHTRKLVVRFNDLEKTVNNNSRKITSLKNVSKTQSQRISGTNIGAKLPGSTTSSVEDNISAIAASVNSIAEILAGRKKAADDAAAFDRKKAEQEKRGLAESKLEKVIGGIAKTAEKVIAPVKSLLDRIFDFIGKIILGRILYLILEWMGNKDNASKLKSLIRFFTDWGPTLLSLYIVFGTSFGKFARGLISLVIKSTVRLGAAVAALAVKAGIGKAGGKLSKVAGFLGGRKGKLLAAGLEAGVTVAGTVALSNTLKGDGGEQQPKAQGLVGGGYVRPRFPAFSGGGFNFKGMLGGAGMGAAFGPLGMLLGGAFGSGKPQEMMSGFVSGEKGVDKIPAMLSDGEFVMSRGAVAKYGVDTLEAMNAAGGGTNKPKIMSGTTYAAGGGLFGKDPGEGAMPSKDPITGIKNFIKYKLGYDVDKPQTWGASFGAGISGMPSSFGMGGRPSSFNLGIPNLNNIQQQVNLGLDPRSYRGLLKSGGSKLRDVMSTASKVPGNIKNKILGTVDAPLAALEKYGTSREDALIKSGELKPGAALTKTMQANLDKSDAWIKSLYDPKKDKGPIGKVKQIYQDIQNKGLTPDLTAMMGLKSEGFEKFVEKASGGRVKNFGAKLTGLQYAVKGLMGPLGKAFRIDDGGSLGRYVKPAIMEAQRRGQGGVGAVGLGQKDYDRLMGDKLANLALGQFNFKVDKGGRATTDDTYEANKPAGEYFKTARQSLKSGDIGGALFKAVSGVLRINQNTGWGNLRPGGAGIDLGGGFTPTDSKGKPIPPNKSSSSVALYGPNDPRRKQSGSYQSRFARPKNAGVKPVKPPVKPSPKIVYGPPVPKPKNRRGSGKGGSSPSVPQFSAKAPSSSAKSHVLGVQTNRRGGR